MKSRIRSLMVSSIAAACLLASVNTANAAIELSALMPIDAIFTNPQGGFLLLLPASNPSCGNSGNQFNVEIGQLSMTADGAKGALAAVLTAYALGKPIRVYFDRTIPGCPISEVMLAP